MNEPRVCEVCGCKYWQAVMPGGIMSEDTRCPAEKKSRLQLDVENDVWKERILKHHPEFEL